MKQWMKKALALVLCAVVVLCGMPVTLRAETAQTAPLVQTAPDTDEALQRILEAGEIAKAEDRETASTKERLDAWAKAQDAGQTEDAVKTIPVETEDGGMRMGINPVYAHLFDESMLMEQAARYQSAQQGSQDLLYAQTFHDNLDDALYDAAVQMTGRAEIYYICFEDYGEFFGSYMYNRDDDSLYSLTEELMFMAMEHNGDPEMGDYLRHNFVPYSVYKPVKQIGSNGMHQYTVKFEIGFFTDAADELEMENGIADLLDELDVYSASDYEKVKAVYDWICANVDYDTAGAQAGSANLYCHSAHAALTTGKAVCQGYALLLYRMLLELRVDNRIITGFNPYTGEGHAWNIVGLDYQYYNCDSTWDEGVAPENYRYFLGGEDAFLYDSAHYREEEYDTAEFHSIYPMAWDAYTPGQDAIELDATGLSLSTKDYVKYNLYFDVNNVPEDAVVYTIGMYVYDYDPSTTWEFDPLETVRGARHTGVGNRYVLQTSGIAPKQMGDTLWFEPFVTLSDGSVHYNEVVSKSVKSYTEDILKGDYSADMKALSVAMLNYAAQAQTYFDYNTDALANSGLTAEQKALADAYRDDMLVRAGEPDAEKIKTFAETEEAGDLFLSTTLGGQISINYYFEPMYAPDANSVKLYYWDQDSYNDLTKLTPDNADHVMTMEYIDAIDAYYASSPALTAREMDDLLYGCIVYTSGGETYCDGVKAHGIDEYCGRMMDAGSYSDDELALAKAMVVYGYYADKYFG